MTCYSANLCVPTTTRCSANLFGDRVCTTRRNNSSYGSSCYSGYVPLNNYCGYSRPYYSTSYFSPYRNYNASPQEGFAYIIGSILAFGILYSLMPEPTCNSSWGGGYCYY